MAAPAWDWSSVMKCCMKNGGTLTAESEIGKGSRFSFTLPVSIRHDSGIDAEEQHAEITAAEVADALLATHTDVSAELLADFRETIIPQFEEVSPRAVD